MNEYDPYFGESFYNDSFNTNVDYEMIQRGAKAIFDTKNVMKNVKARENIEAL